jgi:two-component system cell cycle response regulator
MELEGILGKLTEEERVFVTALIDKDPLTGVYNRRKFERDIELVVAMSERGNRGSSLLMIDIDHFKKYNDEYGHQEGDRALRDISQAIEKSMRGYDKIHIYRYGGEEFVIIIPDISTKDAFKIGERLRNNVKKSCNLTISIGISHYKEISDDLQSLISNADKALYEAKRKGRDRVVVYDEAHETPEPCDS